MHDSIRKKKISKKILDTNKDLREKENIRLKNTPTPGQGTTDEEINKRKVFKYFKKEMSLKVRFEELSENQKLDHAQIIKEIIWNGNLYLKERDANDFHNYYLLETLESQKIRREYSEQQSTSSVLFQINNNKIQKLNTLMKSTIKQSLLARKCLICKNVDILTSFVFCKICGDNYHIQCFNFLNEKQTGQFFHRSKIEDEIFSFSFPKNEKQSKLDTDVFWFCQYCSAKIYQKERIRMKLVIPFEIQQIPQIQRTIKYLHNQKPLKGKLQRYCIPSNLEEALKDKKFIFQEECVYLSTAKSFHNSVAYSVEPIEVKFKVSKNIIEKNLRV